MLGSTLLIVVGMYAVAFVLALALIPVATTLGSVSGQYQLLGWAVVVGTIVTIYTGFLKPWVKTVVITTFLLESRETQPDSEMMDRVAERSEKFQELAGKADGRSAEEGSQPPSESIASGDGSDSRVLRSNEKGVN
ncbi:hypothetical protein [Halostagnicola bangensis]